MATVSELTSKNIASAQANVQTWGNVLYNVKVYGAKADGVTDDTTSIKTATESGGYIVFPKGTYKVTDTIVVPENTEINLSGSTINFVLSTTIPGFWVKGNNVKIYNGTINVVGTTMGGNGHSLNCITAGHQSDGIGYKNLKFTDLTVSTNRNDAGASIGIMGECSDVVIENIIVPDNPDCRNVIGCEWGGTVAGTGHPHNIIIKNIKIGKLTYPTFGSSGYAYGVWLSACFNVVVENVSMEEGYGLVMTTRGDNANTYAPAEYKDQVGTGIEVSNASIQACYGYGIRAIGSNRNVTLDNIPMSTHFNNITVIGKKIGVNNNFGFSLEQSKNVRLTGFKFSGVLAVGITTGISNDDSLIENGHIEDCELYGLSLGQGAINPVVRNVKFIGNNSLGGTGVGTAAITMGDTTSPIIEGCTFGEVGVTETQKYNISASSSTKNPHLNNNHTYNILAGGVSYLINVSTTPEINARGVNNTSESGITNAGGAPIFLISTVGNRMFWFAANPTSGQYEIGDIVYYTTPTAGGFIGAVCTTAGNPGTWKTFGAITA